MAGKIHKAPDKFCSGDFFHKKWIHILENPEQDFLCKGHDPDKFHADIFPLKKEKKKLIFSKTIHVENQPSKFTEKKKNFVLKLSTLEKTYHKVLR